jgi:hypothetical protein
MRGVPRVVGLDVAVEQVAERRLYSRVIHRSRVPESRWVPRPPELVPGGRRRMRSG